MNSINTKIHFPVPIRPLISGNSLRNQENFAKIVGYGNPGPEHCFIENHSIKTIPLTLNIVKLRFSPKLLKPDAIAIPTQLRTPLSPKIKNTLKVTETGQKTILSSFNPSLMDNSPSTKQETNKQSIASFKNITLSILRGNPVTPKDIAFSPLILNILREILTKKLRNVSMRKANRQKLNKNFLEESADRINCALRRHSSRKRVEENNKFIFKIIMFEIKNEFCQQQGLTLNKETETAFYNYYFLETSQQLGRPMNHFYDPLYRVALTNDEFKSINSGYLKLIFQSERLRARFESYLEDNFLDRYRRISEEKIKGVLRPLETALNTKKKVSITNEIYENFTSRLRRSRKCKLPWTQVEVQKAMNQFRAFLVLK
jgi:hypothetical protein